MLAGGLPLISALGLLHLGIVLWVLLAADLAPTAHAHDAMLLVMFLYLLFHAGLATILSLLQKLRVRPGYVSVRLPYEPVVLRPFWLYTLAVFWISVVAFLFLPGAW